MKLCNCPALHFDHNTLSQDAHRYCKGCMVDWSDMREPLPDILGRFMDGSLVIHWRDGYVNLVDVGGDRLIAKRYYQ